MKRREAVRVLVFSPYYPPAFRAGGPVKSVSELVAAAPRDFAVRVVTRNWDLGDRSPISSEPDSWASSRGAERIWRFSGPLACLFVNVGAACRLKPDITYLNSLFDVPTALLPALLWRYARRPGELVVAPRGQLAETARSRKSGRKSLVLRWWAKTVASPRVAVHAATEDERGDVERMWPRARVVVRANEAGPLLPLPPATQRQAQTRRAVFLGRLHPIKGLREMLLSLRSCRSPLCLDVYGPSEDQDYVADCRRIVDSLPSMVRVTFKGPQVASQVRRMLSEYDVMLNPTRGESFGQAIGEALSVGTPVLLPPVTPWTPWIEQSSGGRLVRGDRWAEAIDGLGAQDVQGMRQGARRAYEAWWASAASEPHLFLKVHEQAQ